MPRSPHRPDDTPPAPKAARPGVGTVEAELRALREELTQLREHRMVRLYQSVPQVLLFRLAAGMAMGLGTVLGATVLLSLIVWSLSQIEFIPIIGDWAAQVVEEMKQESAEGR